MKVEYFFIGLLGVLCPFAIGSPEPTCPPEGLEFYRDATNCSRYFECDRGNLTTIDCEAGSYYNEKIRACDPPQHVDCDPVCPYPSDSVDLLYDPKNCSSYYECNRGRRISMTCPPELPFWNHIGLYCDFAEYVDCSRDGTTTPISTTSTSTPSISTLAPTDLTTIDPTDCPSSGKAYLVYPADCSMYYFCDNGKKTVEKCPEGLLFNDVTLQCDFYENVNCDHASTHLPYPVTTASPSTRSTSTSAPTATPSTTTSSGPTGSTTVHPTDCPSSGKAYLVYPADCSMYYFCNNGKKTVEKCPEGLLFNDVTLQCDFYENVNCDHASTHLPYPVTTASPSTRNTSPSSSTATPSSSTSSTSTGSTTVHPTDCPSSGKAYLVYPADCSMYYLCNNGKKTVEKCPEGLLFNDLTLQCDFYENVNCDHASTHLPYPVTTASPSTRSTSTSAPTATPSTTTSPGPTGSTTVHPTDCPSSGKAYLVYPADCSMYYFCNNGKMTVEKCPEGLLFNDVTLQCDFYENVNCDHASTHLPYPVTTTSPSTRSTSTSAPTATSSSSTSSVPTGSTTVHPTDCPSSGKAYLVYPADCSMYYFCNNGKKTVEKCPEGLLFNDLTLQCDFYENVKCVAATLSTRSTPSTSSNGGHKNHLQVLH